MPSNARLQARAARGASSCKPLFGGTRSLVAGGFRVRVLARNEPAAGTLSASVEFFSGDVTDQKAVAAATDGAQVVHHLAGLAHSPSASDEDYFNANVHGTAVVARVARAATAMG